MRLQQSAARHGEEEQQEGQEDGEAQAAGAAREPFKKPRHAQGHGHLAELRDQRDAARLDGQGNSGSGQGKKIRIRAVREKLTELEALVQDDDGKPIDDEAMDEAAIQAKVKEVEESMHAISSKLYEAAAAEMAEAENSEGDGNINVESDDVVDADFEVVDEED